jgi:adenine-specific DNA-methyltransferase
MFDEKSNLSDPIDLPKLREYVWYVETKAPYTVQVQPEYLGCFQGIGYYLLMNESGPIPLTYGTLAKITQKQDGYVVYGESCALSEEFVQKNHITFKKIPNQLARI